MRVAIVCLSFLLLFFAVIAVSEGVLIVGLRNNIEELRIQSAVTEQKTRDNKDVNLSQSLVSHQIEKEVKTSSDCWIDLNIYYQDGSRYGNWFRSIEDATKCLRGAKSVIIIDVEISGQDGSSYSKVFMNAEDATRFLEEYK